MNASRGSIRKGHILETDSSASDMNASSSSDISWAFLNAPVLNIVSLSTIDNIDECIFFIELIFLLTPLRGPRKHVEERQNTGLLIMYSFFPSLNLIRNHFL